jgi:hypothetical protein
MILTPLILMIGTTTIRKGGALNLQREISMVKTHWIKKKLYQYKALAT